MIEKRRTRKGWQVNTKRVQRIWRREGLKVGGINQLLIEFYSEILPSKNETVEIWGIHVPFGTVITNTNGTRPPASPM